MTVSLALWNKTRKHSTQTTHGGRLEQLGGFRSAHGFGQAACSPTICISGTRCPTCGTKLIFACSTSSCGNFDAAGVTLPGLPYVIVGHNQRNRMGLNKCRPTVEDVLHRDFQPGRPNFNLDAPRAQGGGLGGGGGKKKRFSAGEKGHPSPHRKLIHVKGQKARL